VFGFRYVTFKVSQWRSIFNTYFNSGVAAMMDNLFSVNGELLRIW